MAGVLWLIAAAGLLNVLGRSHVVAAAMAATADGVSAMLLVVVMHALSTPWVLALWTQAPTVGVVLPLLAILLARAWSSRSNDIAVAKPATPLSVSVRSLRAS